MRKEDGNRGRAGAPSVVASLTLAAGRVCFCSRPHDKEQRDGEEADDWEYVYSRGGGN